MAALSSRNANASKTKEVVASKKQRQPNTSKKTRAAVLPNGVPNGVPSTSSTLPLSRKRARPPAPEESPTENGVVPPSPVAAKRPKHSTRDDAINPLPDQVLAVFVFGGGECGELGLGPKVRGTTRPKPHPSFDPDNKTSFHIVQLDCGGMHTVALTEDNKIVTWGVNDNGALGRDTTWEAAMRDADADSDADSEAADMNPLETNPIQIPSDHFPPHTRFVQVAAGDSCSFALTDTGLVFGWGTFVNSEGKKCFGHGTDNKPIVVQNTPLLISGLPPIVQITCGANHALALDSKGNVWAWGAGEQNQLGRRIFGRHQTGAFEPRRVEIARNNAKYIASGQYHSFAVDGKGNVWAWGLNSYGQAGYAQAAGSDDTLLPYPMKVQDLCGKDVKVLAGGSHHSVAVTGDGQFLGWGRMDAGQLGIEFSSEQLDDPTLIRRDERNRPRICLRPAAITGIGKARHASCGTDHTLFISRDGKAYSTGFGSSGQLGLGSEDDVETAQLIKGKHVNGRELIWSGAGGGYSVVAATPDVRNGENGEK